MSLANRRNMVDRNLSLTLVQLLGKGLLLV